MFRSILLTCLVVALCLITIPCLTAEADAQVIQTDQKILGRQLSCFKKGERFIPGVMRKTRFVRWRRVFKKRIVKLTKRRAFQKAQKLKRKLRSKRYRRKLKKRCENADNQPQPTSSPTTDPTSSPTGTPTTDPTFSPTPDPTLFPPNPATGIFVDLLLAPENGGSGDCSGNYDPTLRACSHDSGSFVAFDTPQEAADVVEPGKIVYFREGEYVNHADLSSYATVMTILRNGAADNPITFVNYNNEKVTFSGARPSGFGHYYAILLGVLPSSNEVISGQGVRNIILDGLIVEDAHSYGVMIGGPANSQAESAQNPTENIIIRNMIMRNNGYVDGGTPGGGLHSRGKLVNVLVENCEVYNNTGTGIGFGRVADDWHDLEPENDMSAAQYSTIRNCLAYNNSHPTSPGNTDGMGSSHTYRCKFENNVVFDNSDDGMDTYASIEATIKNNIVFGHDYPGGNGAGIKFSAGGGGRHTVIGNVVFNNEGWTFEASGPSHPQRVHYPSKIYNNLAYNGYRGFNFSSYADLTYPGYKKAYLRNNVSFDNVHRDIDGIRMGQYDSDYNLFKKDSDLAIMLSLGGDTHSLSGDPQVVNRNVVIDTSFLPAWSTEEKLNHIRNQVKVAFSPTGGSPLIDQGILIDGIHCASPGSKPEENCQEWFGNAPDIGPFDYDEN